MNKVSFSHANEEIGRNSSDMAIKNHSKHQVVSHYFDNKVKELQQQESEQTKNSAVDDDIEVFTEQEKRELVLRVQQGFKSNDDEQDI